LIKILSNNHTRRAETKYFKYVTKQYDMMLSSCSKTSRKMSEIIQSVD